MNNKMKRGLGVFCLLGAMLPGLSAAQQALPNSAVQGRAVDTRLTTMPAHVGTNANANASTWRAALAATPPEAKAALPTPGFDYSVNLKSEVFGAQIFAGNFAREGVPTFNPDYAISIGDKIQVRLWGAFEFDQLLEVDPRGSIFLPHVGPLKVLGVKNHELQKLVEGVMAKVFKANVSSYASLAVAQPVRVFVGGYVNRPGVYSGASMDGLLYYLDKAGGIDPDRGSFLSVQVKRGTETRASVNLYDFLLGGVMPLTQLSDGDVIFVEQKKHSYKVTGLVDSQKIFEFSSAQQTVADAIKLAKPGSVVTHVRITRNTGAIKNVEYYPMTDAGAVPVRDGDVLEFVSDRKPGTITVRVEGEHASAQEYVLPYDSKLNDLIGKIQFTDRSDRQSLQLFRLSVKDRQREMLATSLKSLESAVLTARSGTSDEARLRKEEADLILQWVDRAKAIEPSGQVQLASSTPTDQVLLEHGDVIRVPTKDGLVLVSGEVLFPTSIIFSNQLTLADYIKRAGGYTQNAESARVVVAHRDGSFTDGGSLAEPAAAGEESVRPGDQILVLPKIDVKSRQVWKDLTQIIYQVAVSAKVIFGL